MAMFAHNLTQFANNELSTGTGSRFWQMFDLSLTSVLFYISPFIFRGTLFLCAKQHIKYPTIYRLLEEYEIEFAILVPAFCIF